MVPLDNWVLKNKKFKAFISLSVSLMWDILAEIIKPQDTHFLENDPLKIACLWKRLLTHFSEILGEVAMGTPSNSQKINSTSRLSMSWICYDCK